MKRKAIALLLSFTILSLSTTAYAADTVQNAPTINSSGKLVIENTDITIDSKDLTDLASVINNNATILTNVKGLSKQNETNIATSSDEYSSSKTYKEGGLCIKDGSLYQCTSEITTPEAWNSSHWKRISLSDAFNSLSSDINNIQASFQDGVDSIYDALVNAGSTPTDKTPSAIIDAIPKITKNAKYKTLVSWFNITGEQNYDKSFSGTADHDGIIVVYSAGKWGVGSAPQGWNFYYTAKIGDTYYANSQNTTGGVAAYPISKGQSWYFKWYRYNLHYCYGGCLSAVLVYSE